MRSCWSLDRMDGDPRRSIPRNDTMTVEAGMMLRAVQEQAAAEATGCSR